MKSPAEILSELVSIPSVHPEATDDASIAGEARLADWLTRELRRLGATVKCPLLAPNRPMVVGVFEPARTAVATIALVPHLDTVGVQGMTVPPFQLSRRGGKLYGRGACDTKGAMAALLWALERWTASPARRTSAIRWIVAATAGEEQGSLGAQALVQQGFRPDFAIALEPTDLRVVSAAKGILRVWVETKGRAAHGSSPERGVNAVTQLLPFVSGLEQNVVRPLHRRRHPLLGKVSVNLGIFEGGAELNVVPAFARAGLDIRTHPQCDDVEALRVLRAALRRCCPRAKLRLHRRGPAFTTDRGNSWAAQLRAVAWGWAAANWFCDANIFADAGIPAVAFGPGSIAQAHTKDEFIKATELKRGGEAFLRFLTNARMDA